LDRAPCTTAIARVADLQVKLGKSVAYLGWSRMCTYVWVYYADDLQSTQLGAIYAASSHKDVPFAGFYHTSDRIAGACYAEYRIQT